MNAYELADKLELNCSRVPYAKEGWTMLRQQADRITELEFNIRMNEMKYLERIEELELQLSEVREDYKIHAVEYMERFEELEHCLIVEQEHNQMLQHKELSDEEIGQIFADQTGFPIDGGIVKGFAIMDFARAIIKASRGEE